MTSGQFVSKCTADAMARAAQTLQAGHLVAFPTETVYGLGADATNASAVARIYEAKGRPADHPLIVHVGDMQDIADWSDDIPDYAIALARNFWPGPMTLILKRSALAQDFITGGQDTVGLRVPNHVIALALLSEFKKLGGKGVAAPSANRFGHVSPTTAQAVSDELSQYLAPEDVLLEGGPSLVGVESTIIDCTTESPKILRPGAITEEMIEAVTGIDISYDATEIRVSGSLENHYSPNAQVVLDIAPENGDGFIALASTPTPDGVIRLSSPQSNEDFARVLYTSLRSADEQSLSRVVVHQPSGDDISVAIRDRLLRASRGR
ncbi:L-threonylcarbamoyladenylate synthase [Candidatus Planktophila sulfonica]|uniref:Threonylcarbamoyl-AMP synthase n=1 Tax=Candidatus Planktophila sulfonica TaxID=1884904 RepID=A0A249KIQ1_9ACTN|nr:L-threonylcarbamoyladenylate synthase [Candidatus Planktophila sulfonica]ASY16661.1 L-threonylcarbamoyladenylate synthase [Candidatus Planktophila sulfonica]